MKRKLKQRISLICVVLLMAFLPANALAFESVKSENNQMTINTLSEIPDIENSGDINQQVVIIYNQSSAMNVQSLFLSTNEVISGETVSDRVDVLEVKNDVNIDEFINKVNENPNVLVADRNKIINTYSLPNDPYVTDGKAWQFQSIGTDKTWDQVSNSDTIGVAVLDTGLNTNHPDLVGRTITGYDYVTRSTDVIDQDGHGTLVSGFIAAAADNGEGISGIAGSANIKIAPYRVGAKGLTVSNICAALMDAANRSDIKVINMSYGGYEYNNSEAAAIQYAKDQGKVLVAASGNEGEPTDRDTGLLSYPASYDGVISVAATTSSNSRASFSQYNNMVDLAAPGENVYTTDMTGGYSSDSGTSFSSPIVAGACGVLLAGNSKLSAADVENILETTALDLGNSGRDDYYGYGLIQLDQALAKSGAIKPLTAINLNKSATAIDIGSSERLTVTFSPENTSDDRTITWTTANPAVATVDRNGNLTGINHGQCIITASVGNLSATCQVSVPNQPGDISALYKTHIENLGWETDWKYNGDLSGTSGKSLRLEGVEIKLDNQGYDVGVAYKTHVQNIGWEENWIYNGNTSGTVGRSLRLEAIQIQLTGADAEKFDIYYRTHVENLGWLKWTLNGNNSGSAGYGYRLEGIEVMVVKKGTGTFDTSGDAYIINPS